MGRVATYNLPLNPNEFIGVNVKGKTRFSAFALANPDSPSPDLMLEFAYEPSNFNTVPPQTFILTPYQVFNSWVVCDYTFNYEQSTILYFRIKNEGKSPIILSVHTEIDMKGDGF